MNEVLNDIRTCTWRLVIMPLLCALGFHKSNWEYTAPKKCSQQRVCTRCGIVEMRTTHSFSIWNYVGYHHCTITRHCSRCDTTEQRGFHKYSLEHHYVNDYSCQMKEVCRVCGHENVLQSEEHDWTAWRQDSEDSSQVTRYCQHCGKEEIKPSK